MKALVLILVAGCSDATVAVDDLSLRETPDLASLAVDAASDLANGLMVLDPTPGHYQTACDGSGGVALDGKYFLGVNDEDQRVQIFERGKNAAALQTMDVNGALGLVAGDEADLEDAARIGNRIFIIGSHGRDKSGKLAPTRQRLFALDVSGTAPGVTLTAAGSSSTLLSDILDASRWTTPNSAIITLLANSTQFGTGTDATLAPDVNGTNIEGLAALPSGGLAIGFRNPRSGADAIVVTLLNPDAMLSGAHAQLGEAMLLDLGGLAVRGMAWSPTHQAILILAGTKTSGGPYQIYKWMPSQKPVSVATLTPPADLAPEGIIPYPNTLDVQVIFDQGDLMIAGQTCKKSTVATKYFTDQIVHID